MVASVTQKNTVGAVSFSCSRVHLAGETRAAENTYFCQAARQLSCVPSSQLCVRIASGGDPTYAFNIRFTGEEVHGTSQCHTLPPTDSVNSRACVICAVFVLRWIVQTLPVAGV